MVKMHQAVKGTVSDPERMRSLCGRGSSFSWCIDTIENRQNIGDSDQVNCKFCLRIMAAKEKMESRA